MALQPCRECGKEVSTLAMTCPHCGVRRPTAKTAPARAGGTWRAGIAIGALALFAICARLSSSSGGAAGPSAAGTPGFVPARSSHVPSNVPASLWAECLDSLQRHVDNPSLAEIDDGPKRLETTDSTWIIPYMQRSYNDRGEPRETMWACGGVRRPGDSAERWNVSEVTLYSIAGVILAGQAHRQLSGAR
jgi:hypothetical protein